MAIRVNDRSVTRYDSSNILGSALTFASRIDLKYDENNLSLTVASNSYIDNAHRKLYEYRLEGLSKDWTTKKAWKGEPVKRDYKVEY